MGDTIHVESEVTEHRLTSKGDRGLVRFANKVVNQRGETVIEYVRWVMVKKRDFAVAAPEAVVPDLAAKVPICVAEIEKAKR